MLKRIKRAWPTRLKLTEEALAIDPKEMKATITVYRANQPNVEPESKVIGYYNRNILKHIFGTINIFLKNLTRGL